MNVSALPSAANPPSIGFPISDPTDSTDLSFAIVAAVSGGKLSRFALRGVEQKAAKGAGQGHGAEPPPGRGRRCG